MDQIPLAAGPNAERVQKLVERLAPHLRRGDGAEVSSAPPFSSERAGRRWPVPYWATALFVALVLGVMWMPSRWAVESVVALHGQRDLTPARLSGPAGPGPALSARRPTVIRAASDGTRPMTFRLLAPAAREVLLGGSFNGFTGSRQPLVRGKDGVWETTVSLAPGRHTYKFKVDGKWQLDPTNPEKTPDPRAMSLIDVPN